MSGSYQQNRTDSKNISQDRVDESQSPYLKDLYSRAKTLSGRSADESVAGFTPMQQQGFGAATNYAQGGGQDIYNQSANALNFGLNAADVNQNPYFQQAMQSAIRPLTQNYQENVLSGNEDQALASGQYGSSRHGVADALSSRDYMNAVGDVTANMGSQAYGQGLNTMMQSLGQAGNVQNMGLFGANTMQNVGAQQQGMNQAMLDSDWNNLSRYQQAIGDPNVLNQSSGFSTGRSFRVAGGMGGGST